MNSELLYLLFYKYTKIIILFCVLLTIYIYYILNTLEDNLTSLKIRREKKSMMMMLSSICLSVVISLLTFIPSTFSRDIVLLQGANFELVRIMNTPVFCRILKSNLLFIGSYHLQVYCYSLL